MSRHPQLLSKDKSAILLIDYQEKFAPHLYDNEQTLLNIKFFLSGVKIYNLPMFVSEHVPDKLGKTLPELKDCISNATIFTKTTMSCCGSSDLVKMLKKKKIEQIAICGIEAHICVMQTALDLIHNGFQVHLIVDAITTRIASNKHIAIARIEGAGGVISCIESALFEIAYEADNDKFKQLQQLYKKPANIK